MYKIQHKLKPGDYAMSYYIYMHTHPPPHVYTFWDHEHYARKTADIFAGLFKYL